MGGGRVGGEMGFGEGGGGDGDWGLGSGDWLLVLKGL